VKWPTALARQKCPGARRIKESVLTGVSFPSHATTIDICSRLIDTAIKKRWEHHTSWQRYVKIKVKSFWSHTGPQSGNNLSLCGPHSHTNLHCRDFNLSLTWLNYSEKVVVCFYFNVLANCSVSQIKNKQNVVYCLDMLWLIWLLSRMLQVLTILYHSHIH